MRFTEILCDPATIGPALLTARVLAVSAVLFLLLGVPTAWFVSRKSGWLRNALSIGVTLPLVFPPIAVGFFLLLILGREGPLGWLLGDRVVFSFPGLALAAFIAGLPLMVRPVQAALEAPEVASLAELSETLGKTPTQTALWVLFPAVRRSIAAGLLLALGRAMGEVGMTLLLGGNILGKTNTLSLEIYNAVIFGEFDRALVLSALVGVAAVGVFITLKRWSTL